MLLVLMSISLAGVVVVQWLWFSNALSMKHDEFDRSVNEALNKVVTNQENKETAVYIMNNLPEFEQCFDSLGILIPPPPPIPTEFSESDSSLKISIETTTEFDDSISTKIEKQIHDKFSTNFDFRIPHLDSIVVSCENFGKDSVFKTQKENFKILTQHLKVTKSGFPKVKKSKNVIQHQSKKIGKVFTQMAYEFNTADLPVEERISKRSLDSTLKKELQNKGISIAYEFAVVKQPKDSVLAIKSDNFRKLSPKIDYKVSLFPNEIFDKNYFLNVQFPKKESYILKSMSVLMAGALIFTLIILLTFSTAILIIVKQKRMSDVKSDFINNMTHEFKTPIATISLAADSIINQKIIHNPEQIQYFTGMIKEENKRMNSLVESVLQMSLLDKKEFSLKPSKTDVHGLINKAITQMSLQIEKRDGKIITDLNASNSIVWIDSMMFTNVLYNLLDNANKYSPDSPEIAVKTRNEDGKLIVSIHDKGIGMSKEVQKRIFEKFYREATGNVHNVKGFGLGLSFVKAIVTASGGEITVNSEKGKGSHFDVVLPLLFQTKNVKIEN